MVRAGASLSVLAWLSLLAAGASASIESERLQAQGLVRFHAGQLEEALELFDRAIAADAGDWQSLYYRGVTRARMGDIEGAAVDLRTVLEARPEFRRAALDLGIVLMDAGRGEEAMALLQQATADESIAADAHFHLGLAQIQAGQDGVARENLRAAAQREPQLQVPVHYYLGVLEARAGNRQEALRYFTAVAQVAADTALGREAAAAVERLRVPVRRRYSLTASLGLQYDSNVALAPADDREKAALGVSDEADGRFTIAAGAWYFPVRSSNLQVGTGYDFFQSLHFDQDGFNLQNHRASVLATGKAGPVQPGLLVQYDFYLRKDDQFLQQATALPWMVVPEGKWGRFEVHYRMRRNDFLDSSFDLRDAFNHSAGARQVFYAGGPDHWVAVGYRFDREEPVNEKPLVRPAGPNDPDPDMFAYDGHEIGIGLGCKFSRDVVAELSYSYRRERYDRNASGGRLDKENLLLLAVHLPVHKYVTVSTGYLADFNDSNQDPFEYDRHILTLSAQARY